MSLDLSGVSMEDLVKALIANPQGAALINNAQARQAADNVVKPTTRFMINTKHGYLVPATVHNWNNAELQPFNGNVRPATPQEGMAWLSGGGGPGGDATLIEHRRRNGTLVEEQEEPAFDLNAASPEEIVAFAFQNFGAELDPNTDVKALRKEVRRLATAAQQ